MYSEQEGGKNQRRTYRCGAGKKGRCAAKTRVIADEIEAWTWDQVLRILQNRDAVLAELRRRYDRTTSLSLDTERNLLLQRIADFDEQQSRLIRREGSVPWTLIEREVNRLEEDKAGLRERLAEVEVGITANQQQSIRVDAVVDLIDRLAGADPEAASFEERSRIIRDLGIEVVTSKLMWILDWLVPVNGVVHDGSRWYVDFHGVEEPTDPAERARIEHDTWVDGMSTDAWQESDPEGYLAAQRPAVRRRVQAITSASRSFGSA